ncbi:ABC transporter ATP-binding protein [Aquamicrobium sp. LC103]|uniref:dipeptide ABC transporter ATP-binding protein n=1 Tax=Aquamicrobium sp. LC103 TaxID=1120658 RepID=UPI00063EB2D0|nr:ABC transporter ATP-binding protein [Aquamicrobium sp. LC103]TKT75691.1 ABC transporter ATP-binding protein [Aquamicrobium sp. LC103]
MDKRTVVSIQNLSLRLPAGADREFALKEMNLDLNANEIVCIVGESGSGKSLCAQALMGLLSKVIHIESGRVSYGDIDLLTASQAQLRGIRGARISMIFQEPMTALNPSMRVGEQIAEVFEAHNLLTPAERRARALELAKEVRLPDPEKLLEAYPHQLSGGQRQRAMIAMALALEPDLIIADEPTTALDVTTQAQVLKLIREIQRRRGTAVMFITHDFSVVADIADRVLVLKCGVVVEQGSVDEVLRSPKHEYTKALLAAVPTGTPLSGGSQDGGKPALQVTDLRKTYRSRAGMMGPVREVVAVNGVSFSIARGETLGLVGESGSGKSSIAKLVTRITEPDSGSIVLDGVSFSDMTGEELRKGRSRIQMVFQDPFASLNPRRPVGLSIADGPMARGLSRRDALKRARELMDMVGLSSDAVDRLPHEFSGGQRQRIGIARALALDPDVLIADEAVSALDVTVQAQVLKQLANLKTRLNLAMLFITHDLHVATQVCDRLAVMRRGEIVEIASTVELFANPKHEYTRALLSAIPGAIRLYRDI